MITLKSQGRTPPDIISSYCNIIDSIPYAAFDIPESFFFKDICTEHILCARHIVGLEEMVAPQGTESGIW